MIGTIQHLERIRSKPVVELTPKEIGLLTTQEQGWIYSYRSEVRQRAEAKAAQRREQRRAKAANRIPF